MISITPNNFDFDATEAILEQRLDKHNIIRFKSGMNQTFVPAKDVLVKRIGELQLVPQQAWTDTSVFSSPSVMNLCHPHHRLLWHRILEQYQPKSDVLVVANCACTKPYSKNRTYRWYVEAANKGWFDFAIMSFHPVPVAPLDTSKMYPNIMYDWPHEESNALNQFKLCHNVTLWTEFLRRFRYKKVMFCLSQNKVHVAAYERLKAELPDIEMSLLWDYKPIQQFVSRIYGKTQIWRGRIHQFKLTREFMAQQLGNPEQFRRDVSLN